MARIEADKEDLMVDATALVHRAEFAVVHRDRSEASGIQWNVATVGFRKDDSLSVYFDQDPFYQFDSSGLLRRALEDGFLYRSQTVTLAKLHRVRSEQATTLVRHDLADDELRLFQQRMRRHIEQFLELLDLKHLTQGRTVSDDDGFPARIRAAFQQVVSHQSDFLSNAIRRRR